MEFIDRLFYYSNIFLSSFTPKYKRGIYEKINFDHKLIGIKGAKGVGKTTILKQYLKSLKVDLKHKIYISLDNPLIGDTRLLDIVEELQKRGVKTVVVDEIHYQRDFERDLKTIYDFFDIKLIFSGSSAIALSGADLSRRALIYNMPILSFREYLELRLKKKFRSFTLDDILENHIEIAFGVISKIKPLEFFYDYLNYGAYPFFLEGSEQDYIMKLTAAVNKTIENDLLQIFNIDPQNISLLKKLLITMCQNFPGSFNITSLAREMQINVKTLYNYLDALQKGSLIRLLYYNKKGNALFQKPDKILLANSSLFKVLCPNANVGSIREAFFVSMLNDFEVRYSKNGDYIVNDKYTFEIGGKSKDYKQIKDMKNSYLVLDNLEIGYENKIPLWLFGFLY